MSFSAADHAPLLPSVSQFEVDFVIPRVGVDLPLGIDPFLLFKSRDPALAALHAQILDVFNAGIEAVRDGRLDDARRLFHFPEPAEIGLGHTKNGKRGAGLGSYLTELIVHTLLDSPGLQERGVKHIEEMQLVSSGIGPDRVSDIAANILKSFLIEYTQKQCEIWKLPLVSGVPVSNVLDCKTREWNDDYFDLPISPVDGSPILLVPRRIVRALPWINYEDFFKQEFSAYLRAKKVKATLGSPSIQRKDVDQDKDHIVKVTRSEIERVDRYIAGKEAAATEAQPSQTYLPNQTCAEAERLKAGLRAIAPGRAQADDYQRILLAIFNFLFNPELIDGAMEVRTVDGTERRDIIFTNDSDRSFWNYLRQEHSSFLLMIEAKNTNDLDNNHFNQTATYLGDRMGRLAIIASRQTAPDAQKRKAFSIYNDSNPQRKIILTLSDADLERMLDMNCRGDDPMKHIQRLYREFRSGVQ